MSQRVVIVAAIAASGALGCGGTHITPEEAQQSVDATFDCPAERAGKVLHDELAEYFPPLGTSDPVALTFVSEPRWYTARGARRHTGADLVSDGALNITVQARFKPLPKHGYDLEIVDDVRIYETGSPVAGRLLPGDARRPRWLEDKLVELRVSVFRKLRDCTDQLPAAPAPG